MLISNLRMLLAERNLKITTVSGKTGISRTTLTALNTDSSKMIQFETINTLSAYLHVVPADFFLYTPINMQIEITDSEEWKHYDTVLGDNELPNVEFDAFNGKLKLTFSKDLKFVDSTEMDFKVDKFSLYQLVHPNVKYPKESTIFIVIPDSIMDRSTENFGSFWTENKLEPFYETVYSQIENVLENWLMQSLEDAASIYDEKEVKAFVKKGISLKIELPVSAF